MGAKKPELTAEQKEKWKHFARPKEQPCPHCGTGSKFHLVNERYCKAYQDDEVTLLQDELRALKHTIVATIGGTDDEGIPTSEINYLQRLRALVEFEKRINGEYKRNGR